MKKSFSINKLAGVVIVYLPEIDILLKNIESYIEYLDILFVIGNSQLSNEEKQKLIKADEGKIRYIQNAINKGIANPLNHASKLALERNYKWLLTMDQDTSFTRASLYFDFLKKKFLIRSDVAVIAPSFESKINYDKILFEEVKGVITSGSLINLNLFRNINGFTEKLFIDEVDYDYCYKAYIKGYKIVKITNRFLDHHLGREVNKGYGNLIKVSKRRIHSPARVYFMVRNFLYLNKTYKTILPLEIRKRKRELFVSLKNNLLFSNSFFENLKNIFQAVKDFRNDNFTRTI